MKKHIFATGLLCSATLIAFTGTLHAQEEKLIENQRTNIIYNASWGDTYLGKYTSENGLTVSNATLNSADAYVGYTDTALSNLAFVSDSGTWNMDSLQIGSDNNMDNWVIVGNEGTIQIDGSLSILGATNGNAFVLGNGGTLYMKSDFDASMEGFFFNANGTLKVGGTLINMDQVEGQRHLILTGADAEWILNTNTLYIGAATDGNSVSLESGADFTFENISIGSLGTISNMFTVGSGSHATISSNIWIEGSSNYLSVAGGEMNVLGNLTSDSLVQFEGSGKLKAFGNLDLPGIDGDGTLTLSGDNAVWTNNMTIGVGILSGGSTLLVESNALVSVESILIGWTNTSDNAVILQDQGKLVLKGNGSYISDGSSLVVNDGGWLTFGSDASSALSGGTNASFYWNTGGTLEFQGEAPIFEGWELEDQYLENGTLFLGEGRTMILNGSNAYLDAYTNNFHLGDLSSDNTFVVSNGAWAAFKTASIGDFKEGGDDNLLLVSGSGSVVTNLGFTAIGGTVIGSTWHEGGNGNLLRVEDGALFYSPGTLHNQNSTGTSGLEIASGGVVDVNNYYQGSGAYLTVLADSTGTNAGLLRANNAEFEEGARIGVDAVSRLQLDQMYTNTIVEADTLIVAGVTNGTTADLASLGTSGGSLVKFDLSLNDGTNIVATYRRRYLSEASGFNTGTMLSEIADEIDSLSMQGNAAASNQLNIINMLSSSKVSSQLKQLYAYQLPTYLHNQGVFGGIDQVRARGSSFHKALSSENMTQPAGVMGPGPHSPTQELQIWTKIYGSYGNRDKTDVFNDGYDSQVYGTVLGLDRAFNDWLFGVAGGYAGSTINGDNDDDSDASTGYGMLYASYGTEDWFGDLIVSYGVSDIENDSGGAFDVESSTDASHTAFYIGGGKEYKDPDGSAALLRPLLALQVSQFDQDGYTEKSSNAVAKDVEGFDRWSYRSIFGAEMILPAAGATVDIETQLRLYWLHEFNDDAEKVDYTLAGSNQPGQFVMRSPESDVAQFGIGCVASWHNGWQLRGDLDAQVSDDFFSTTLSGALLYEF